MVNAAVILFCACDEISDHSAQFCIAMTDWQYVDDEGQAQGPFSNEDMRVWFAVGWLRPDLLVRCLSQKSAVFRPLKDLNPKPSFCIPTQPKAPTPPPRPKSPTPVSKSQYLY